MAPFFLSFLAVALAMLAGREAVRVSRFAAAGANVGALLALVALAAVAGCALAAWLAGNFAELLGPKQQSWFVAAALVMAGLEVIFLDAPKAPREPTQSLGALALVLFAGVLADASGLLVLSLSVATGAPMLAAAGGGLGAAMVLGMAALAGGDWEKVPRQPLRWVVGGSLLAGAFIVALFPPGTLQ
ncbi:MAG: hypothetical protein JY451_09355 [Erythrobacter sp.]|nr:MAG: hypothetical protein JY451_09355 [Erythrobacter sp.]